MWPVSSTIAHSEKQSRNQRYLLAKRILVLFAFPSKTLNEMCLVHNPHLPKPLSTLLCPFILYYTPNLRTLSSSFNSQSKTHSHAFIYKYKNI